jgi:hypothetical protein
MTMLQSTISCPHCNALGQNPGGFCTSCGKALPTAASSGPRVLGNKDLGSSGAARTLRTDELKAQARKAAGALMAVAVVFAIYGTLFGLGGAQLAGGQHFLSADVILNYVVAALFLGLFFWARKSPLPAAIVGLVIFLTLQLYMATLDPILLTRGIIFKIVIIVVLIQAIQAGILSRKIEQEQRSQVI